MHPSQDQRFKELQKVNDRIKKELLSLKKENCELLEKNLIFEAELIKLRAIVRRRRGEEEDDEEGEHDDESATDLVCEPQVSMYSSSWMLGLNGFDEEMVDGPTSSTSSAAQTPAKLNGGSRRKQTSPTKEPKQLASVTIKVHGQDITFPVTDSGHYQCGSCGVGFDQQSKFIKHIKECGETGRCSKRDSNKQPMRLVNGVRKYVCLYCDGDFVQARQMREHVRVKHLQLANFWCAYCHKGFGSKSRIEEHLRIHTQERPFECLVCEQKFKRKYLLHNHQKKANHEVVPDVHQEAKATVVGTVVNNVQVVSSCPNSFNML